MEPTALAELFRQHNELLSNIEKLWIAVVVLAFLGLVFILVIFGTAIWSVRSVNLRQAALETLVNERNVALEGKFGLLIDVLLRQAEREIEARKAAEIRGN